MSEATLRQWVPARSWFLFNTWLSLLVVCVSVGASLQVPLRRVAWPMLIFCCGLVVVLAIRSRRPVRAGDFNGRLIVSSGLIVGTVVVVLWGTLTKGEFVSVFPDPWAYTAHAAYLQNPMPAVGAGLQPIVSFGRQLMNSRYGTAGLLALFAETSGTDPCRAAGIYAFLILVQTGLGLTLLARILGAGRILSVCAGVFGVAIGWAPEILKIGNWDQFLFLSFLPFILVRIRFCTFPTSRTSGVLTLGLCLGATIFVYPEGVAMAGVIYLPLLFWRLIRGSDLLGKLKRLGVAAALALFFSSVYLPRFVSFLGRQIAAGTHLLNAEGGLPGLFSQRWLPAAYGLGEQTPLAGWKRAELIVPLLFLGLSLLALRTWWRKKDGILFALPVFFLLTLWQVALLRYDYGFYKVLTMFWPVMTVAIFVGMSVALAWSPAGLVRSTGAVAFCGIMAAALFDQNVNFQYAPWRAERQMRPFLDLTSLKGISGDAPICLLTESWFNQMWSVFFLQGYKLVVPHPLGYLQHSASGLKNVTTEQEKGTLLLSDEKRPGAIWSNEIFSLQNHLDPLELIGIDAPNSVETVQGDSFLWLDNRLADLTIHSDANRQAILAITECWPGPSRPGDKRRTLMVEVNGARTEWPALSTLRVPLKLNQGYNLVRLSCKEAPTIDKLSSGDNRTLLLGIKGFKVVARDKPVELLAIDAPNAVETVQSDPFIWLDNRWTELTVESDADRRALLTISECWPGPSRPEDTKRTLIVEANGTSVEVPASTNLKMQLNLHQGSNLVRLSCKEAPTVAKPSSGDARTLLLGIKGYSVTAIE